MRVAYMMSRFPTLTETFVSNEILAVERQGVKVEIYPLMRGRDEVVQPSAAQLAARANYLPLFGIGVLASHVRFIRRRPRQYLTSLVHLIRDNLGKRKLLVAALVVFLKAVHAANLMSQANIDHVHGHFARHAALAGLIITRLTGITYSFTAHGSDIHVDRRMLCRKLGEASFAVAISDFNRIVMEDECGATARAKVKVLHCGVDTELFRPRVGDRESSRGPLRILCVGTLHEVKGHVHLISACALLRDMGIDFSCRLVGRGPDEESIRRMIERLGLQDQVKLVGALPRDAVIEELHQANVLATPSVRSARGQREGIPVALMEAMSCGLPVVASRLSGIPELVADDQNGLLVTPGDAQELAQALSRLAIDPELRRRLGEEGRRSIERDFDLHVNAGRLVAMFREAAAT